MKLDNLLSELGSMLSGNTWRTLPTFSNTVLDRIFSTVAQIDCSKLDSMDRKQLHGILVMSLDQANKEQIEMLRRFEEKSGR